MATFFEVITEAINDIQQHGFDSAARLDKWMDLIRAKLIEVMPSVGRSADRINGHLREIYDRLVARGGVLKGNANVSLFTLQQVKPRLHAELQRRIMANAQLIKLNRGKAIDQTLQRFAGWVTSVPEGGSDVVDRKAVKAAVRKPLAALPFEERRLLIDQGLKFAATVHQVVNEGGGAIAVEWHSHWKQKNYNYRPDHKERDGKVYAIKGSWALDQGLINKGAGYTSDMTTFGEEINCRCIGRYFFALRELPDDMLTDKGRAALQAVRDKIKAMVA